MVTERVSKPAIAGWEISTRVAGGESLKRVFTSEVEKFWWSWQIRHSAQDLKLPAEPFALSFAETDVDWVWSDLKTLP